MSMSAGTSVTVGRAHNGPPRCWGGGRSLERGAHLVALTGGGIIAPLALSLLAGSFGPVHPLGM